MKKVKANIAEPLREGIKSLCQILIEDQQMRDLQEWGIENSIEMDNEGNIEFDGIDVPQLQEIYNDLEVMVYGDEAEGYSPEVSDKEDFDNSELDEDATTASMNASGRNKNVAASASNVSTEHNKHKGHRKVTAMSKWRGEKDEMDLVGELDLCIDVVVNNEDGIVSKKWQNPETRKQIIDAIKNGMNARRTEIVDGFLYVACDTTLGESSSEDDPSVFCYFGYSKDGSTTRDRDYIAPNYEGDYPEGLDDVDWDNLEERVLSEIEANDIVKALDGQVFQKRIYTARFDRITVDIFSSKPLNGNTSVDAAKQMKQSSKVCAYDNENDEEELFGSNKGEKDVTAGTVGGRSGYEKPKVLIAKSFNDFPEIIPADKQYEYEEAAHYIADKMNGIYDVYTQGSTLYVDKAKGSSWGTYGPVGGKFYRWKSWMIDAPKDEKEFPIKASTGKQWTVGDVEKLGKEVLEFVKENEGTDTCIYFGGKKYQMKYHTDENYDIVFEGWKIEDAEPSEYFEYTRQPNILSMSFEDGLFDVFNGWTNYTQKKEKEFSSILSKFNLYYELGNSWNLSCFPAKSETEWTDFDKASKSVTASATDLTSGDDAPMHVGDRIYTPRFCTVVIKEMFTNRQEAAQNGYTEPTHYHENGYTICGKSIGENRMIFAGVKERGIQSGYKGIRNKRCLAAKRVYSNYSEETEELVYEVVEELKRIINARGYIKFNTFKMESKELRGKFGDRLDSEGCDEYESPFILIWAVKELRDNRDYDSFVNDSGVVYIYPYGHKPEAVKKQRAWEPGPYGE